MVIFPIRQQKKNDRVYRICRITVDGKISSQVTEVKMALHKGFVKLWTSVTADGDISNQVKEVKTTVH